LRWGLANFLPRRALNNNAPNLCLLRSWDYRHEPPCLAFQTISVQCEDAGCKKPCGSFKMLLATHYGMLYSFVMLFHRLQNIENGMKQFLKEEALSLISKFEFISRESQMKHFQDSFRRLRNDPAWTHHHFLLFIIYHLSKIL
jgi:hypothetical protein